MTSFDEWWQLGLDRGWIGPSFCYVHESPDLTEEEAGIVEAEGGDYDAICMTVARVHP